MTPAAIVLAAGASQRLGQPKQLVRLGKETLLERAVRLCEEADCSPIFVVLGASADLIASQSLLPNATVIVNHRWAEGMASSIAAGVRALGESAEGCLIVTCDMPAITAKHLRRLSSSGQLTASSYSGKRGVPAFFPASSFADLLELRGDAGARDLLRLAPTVDLPGGECDVDTPEDLERLRVDFHKIAK